MILQAIPSVRRPPPPCPTTPVPVRADDAVGALKGDPAGTRRLLEIISSETA